MILADTSVWIDHLRAEDSRLAVELDRNNILMHPFVAGELSMGSLGQRKKILADFEIMPAAPVAHPAELKALIEHRALYGRSIGYIDAHLIAATLLTPDCQIWTRDKRLRTVAESMKIHVQFP
jgi:predicted nucleic acid-binding protein